MARYGTYRSKTCGHCSGDHAILDCKKLIEEAAEAEKALANWTEEDEKIQKRANRMAWEYDWDRQAENYKITEARRVIIRSRNPELWDSIGDISLTITKEEREKLYETRNRSSSQMRNVVSKNEVVREQEAKRAAKACSYCRGKGHTVRTCSQKKEDAKTLENWRLIDSYIKAKALSGAGIWTASMLVMQKDPHWSGEKPVPNKSYVLTAQGMETALHKLSVLQAWVKDKDYNRTQEKMSEDMKHEAAVKACLENLSFEKPSENNRNYDTIGSWYLEYNQTAGLYMSHSYSAGDGYGKPIFLRSHINYEHIFKVLVQRALPPLISKERWSHRNTPETIDRWDSTAKDGGVITYHNAVLTLSYKKKRDGGSWKKIEEFVKINKSILNKAKKINV